jgi:hypothetical protein
MFMFIRRRFLWPCDDPAWRGCAAIRWHQWSLRRGSCGCLTDGSCMPRKMPELTRDLERAGFIDRRGKGSHRGRKGGRRDYGQEPIADTRIGLILNGEVIVLRPPFFIRTFKSITIPACVCEIRGDRRPVMLAGNDMVNLEGDGCSGPGQSAVFASPGSALAHDLRQASGHAVSGPPGASSASGGPWNVSGQAGS